MTLGNLANISASVGLRKAVIWRHLSACQLPMSTPTYPRTAQADANAPHARGGITAIGAAAQLGVAGAVATLIEGKASVTVTAQVTSSYRRCLAPHAHTSL